MKRSEMIHIMIEAERDMMSYKDSNAFMSGLLKKMEEAGMLPPNQYACNNEFRFEWENE